MAQEFLNEVIAAFGARDNIFRFPHRVVELPVKTLDQVAREHSRPFIPPEMLARLNGDAEAVQAIRERLNRDARRILRPSFANRVRDFLDRDALFGLCLGFVTGTLFTAGLAQLVAWAVL